MKEGIKNIAAGSDPMAIKRGMDKTTEVAIKELKEIQFGLNLMNFFYKMERNAQLAYYDIPLILPDTEKKF